MKVEPLTYFSSPSVGLRLPFFVDKNGNYST